MLRVHFLNVGHGDCTIVKHHSGRLTMIDVNNSQDFDSETFAEELEEERRKQRNALSGGFSGGGLGGLGGFGGSSGGLLGGLAGSEAYRILREYAAVADRAKRELTDPIDFLKRTYPHGRQGCRSQPTAVARCKKPAPPEHRRKREIIRDAS